MGPADLPPPTRSMFSKRLEKLLRLSLHERQQWLRLVTSERNRESRLMAARRRMFDPFVRVGLYRVVLFQERRRDIGLSIGLRPIDFLRSLIGLRPILT